jgi:hypothetical protein
VEINYGGTDLVWTCTFFSIEAATHFLGYLRGWLVNAVLFGAVAPLALFAASKRMDQRNQRRSDFWDMRSAVFAVGLFKHDRNALRLARTSQGTPKCQ